jgi:hypothetical protein
MFRSNWFEKTLGTYIEQIHAMKCEYLKSAIFQRHFHLTVPISG